MQRHNPTSDLPIFCDHHGINVKLKNDRQEGIPFTVTPYDTHAL